MRCLGYEWLRYWLCRLKGTFYRRYFQNSRCSWRSFYWIRLKKKGLSRRGAALYAIQLWVILGFDYFHIGAGDADAGAIVEFRFQNTHEGFGFHFGKLFRQGSNFGDCTKMRLTNNAD